MNQTKQMPTLTLQPVKHGEFYVVNGRLYSWNAITQRGEMILVCEDYVANKEVSA